MQLGPDGLLYVTCENSGVVALVDLGQREVVGAIETGSTNAHRLAIAPDGQRLYTENEEDASISVIDLPARKLLRQVSTPHPLAGIAISPDGKVLVAVSDSEPVVFLIDPASLADRPHHAARECAEAGANRALQSGRSRFFWSPACKAAPRR